MIRRGSLVPNYVVCVALAACGGGSGSSGSATSSASIALTDAAADELAVFEVDVRDVVLTRAGGATVSVLRRRARVDFAQLESLAELIVGVGVPPGVYTGLAMTLDFGNATALLVGQTAPATILDESGSLLTGQVDLQVSFPSTAQPSLVASRNHMFLLDLDLDQAISVNTAGNSVTFAPVLTVSVDPLNLKPTAISGVLTAVDAGASTITVQRRDPSGIPIGDYQIDIDASTVFQIDGVVRGSAAGLISLALLVAGQPRVYVQGVLSPTTRTLVAAAVETGAGTPGNGQDWLFGHVVARDLGAGSNAMLTVLGHSDDDPSGTRRFNTLHTVAVSLTDTKVLRRAAGNSLTTDAVSVGQLVWVFGALSGTAMDASMANGVVRMLPTSVYGTAVTTPTGNVLTVNASRIDLRPIGNFNFSVNGATQSTPAAMAVDVAGLSTSGIGSGSNVRATGWFNAVDVVGDDDLAATAVVDYSARAQVMFCQWSPATPLAITAFNTAGLTLDVATAQHAVVGNGFAPVPILASPAPTLQPWIGFGVFTIAESGAFEVHTTFDAFATALASRVSANSPVFRMTALGTYAPSTQTFQAIAATVVLR